MVGSRFDSQLWVRQASRLEGWRVLNGRTLDRYTSRQRNHGPCERYRLA